MNSRDNKPNNSGRSIPSESMRSGQRGNSGNNVGTDMRDPKSRRSVATPDVAFSRGSSAGNRGGAKTASGSSYGRQGYSDNIGRSQRYPSAATSNRRVKSKSLDINSTVIVIVVSVVISIAVLAGVIINYAKNHAETPSVGADGEKTEDIQYNQNSADAMLGLFTLEMSEVVPEIKFPVAPVYGDDGKLLLSHVRGDNGDIDGTIMYQYNGEGVCVCEKMYGRDGRLTYKNVHGGIKDGVSRTLYETEYDSKNNYSGYTETLFDEKGSIAEKIKCSYNGVVESKFDFEFDEEGRVKRENRYTTYGDLSVYTEYKYDSFGNNTEKIQYDPTGKEVLRDLFVFDSQNRITLEEHYTVGVCKSYTEYSYDDSGNVFKRSYILRDEHTMTYEEVRG